MINTIKSTALLGDSPDERSPRKDPKKAQTAGQTTTASSQSDIRLLIEEDHAFGALTYTLIDRATGEVVSKVSREELLKMSADPSYTAGKVIDTKA